MQRDPAEARGEIQGHPHDRPLHRADQRASAGSRAGSRRGRITSPSTSRRSERRFHPVLLFQRARPGRERRAPVRRGPLRTREAGADRLPGYAVKRRGNRWTDDAGPVRAARHSPLALLVGSAAARRGAASPGHPLRTDRTDRRSRTRTIRPRRSASISRGSRHEFPLSRADLMKITPENIAALTQERGRPALRPADGRTDSRRPARRQPVLALATGSARKPNCARGWSEILGGIARTPGRCGASRSSRISAADLWKGKVFFRDQRILRNMIENKPASCGRSSTTSATS